MLIGRSCGEGPVACRRFQGVGTRQQGRAGCWWARAVAAALSISTRLVAGPQPALDRADHRPRLDEHFLPLVLGARLRHDGAARAEADALRRHHRCPDDDVEVRRPVDGEEAEGARVDSAGHPSLELVDDLEGARLGGPRHRARRESACGGVERICPVLQIARHGRHQLVDARVGFDGHQLWHADRADPADAAEVVSHEVDDHQVLGAVLRRSAQGLGIGGVELGRRPSRHRPFDRLRLDGAVGADAQETLGGGAADAEGAPRGGLPLATLGRGGGSEGRQVEVQEGGVRRRVDAAQGEVQRERGGRRRGARRRRAELGRQADLVRLALAQQLEDALDVRRVLIAATRALEASRRPPVQRLTRRRRPPRRRSRRRSASRRVALGQASLLQRSGRLPQPLLRALLAPLPAGVAEADCDHAPCGVVEGEVAVREEPERLGRRG
mmetsp:Transcript_41925/g.132456  ORF Transcript_41925/g.132456 Transcript_41925/m.132456 type:complete len:441 (+) Transcript_41925:102-1424(+)